MIQRSDDCYKPVAVFSWKCNQLNIVSIKCADNNNNNNNNNNIIRVDNFRKGK